MRLDTDRCCADKEHGALVRFPDESIVGAKNDITRLRSFIFTMMTYLSGNKCEHHRVIYTRIWVI